MHERAACARVPAFKLTHAVCFWARVRGLPTRAHVQPTMALGAYGFDFSGIT